MFHNLMTSVLAKYAEARTREEGQGLVEYALILVLISLVAIAIMETIGLDVQGVFNSADTALDNAAG